MDSKYHKRIVQIATITSIAILLTLGGKMVLDYLDPLKTTTRTETKNRLEKILELFNKDEEEEDLNTYKNNCYPVEESETDPNLYKFNCQR